MSNVAYYMWPSSLEKGNTNTTGMTMANGIRQKHSTNGNEVEETPADAAAAGY